AADREHDEQGRRAAGDQRTGLTHLGVDFVLACALFAGGYQLFEWFAACWFFRRTARTIRPLPPGVPLPPVTVLKPLKGPGIGLTSCLYRGLGRLGLPTVLESLFINTDFMPIVLAAQLLDRFQYAYGASIAFRHEALEAIGGFPALADYLADDYHLGTRIARAGYRLVLLPYTVETVLDSVTLGDVWRHLLRWSRTYRVSRPVSWFCAVVTHAMLWGCL